MSELSSRFDDKPASAKVEDVDSELARTRTKGEGEEEYKFTFGKFLAVLVSNPCFYLVVSGVICFPIIILSSYHPFGSERAELINTHPTSNFSVRKY
jgi:hypothetical protein